jgi:acyl-CoA reductase-like NAD-dependent aldehyde dehydrogenase
MALSFASSPAGLALPPTKLLIGGEWSAASDNKRLSTVNPATDEVITEVAEAGPSDIDRAVSAARRALTRGWWATATCG